MRNFERFNIHRCIRNGETPNGEHFAMSQSSAVKIEFVYAVYLELEGGRLVRDINKSVVGGNVSRGLTEFPTLFRVRVVRERLFLILILLPMRR